MRDIDGHAVENPVIKLHCGSWAEFDDGSGYSYRCTTCGCTVGSISEPRGCAEKRREAESKEQVWKALST
jgi:hypothetical protein